MLPRNRRVSLEADIVRVLRRGRMVGTDSLTLRYLPAPGIMSRFGFLVSKKVSNKANKRNLVKRRLRGAVNLHLKQIKSGCDFLFLAKPAILSKDYASLEKEVLGLIGKAGYYMDKNSLV